jgi:hypothetical protein
MFSSRESKFVLMKPPKELTARQVDRVQWWAQDFQARGSGAALMLCRHLWRGCFGCSFYAVIVAAASPGWVTVLLGASNGFMLLLTSHSFYRTAAATQIATTHAPPCHTFSKINNGFHTASQIPAAHSRAPISANPRRSACSCRMGGQEHCSLALCV